MIAPQCPACGCAVEANVSGSCPRCGQAVFVETVGPAARPTMLRGAPEAGATFIVSPTASGSKPAGTHFDFLAPPRGEGEIGWLGPYRVERLLGQGGMGLVFLAVDTGLDRRVALKVLRPEMSADVEQCQRFLREARMAAAVKNDHVVTIHQVGQEKGLYYLAMELLEGESLEDLLQREGRLDLPTALRVAREAALGLAAAHEKGLVHRDVKPGNLFLEGPARRVKVLDFGLARPTAGPSDVSLPGTILGTPDYMAPEQAVGGEVSARTDLFSLGCVIYRMLSGDKPFGDGGTLVVVWAVQLKEPRPLTEVCHAAPPALAGLVERLLAKKPADRPATAREVADALAAIAHCPAVPSPSRKRPRRATVLALAGVLAIAIVLGGYLLWGRPGPAKDDRQGEAPGKKDERSPGQGGEVRPVKYTLNGAGSTLILPLVEKWAAVYRDEKGVRLNYLPAGSGRGLEELLAQQVDFACSEAPLTDQQLKLVREAGRDVLYVPLALGAVVPVYNLEGQTGPLRFSGPVLAKIYLGEIRRWNDPALMELNPGARLPDRPIVVVRRADLSGTTFVFTDYLGRVSQPWAARVGTTELLKVPGVAGKGNEGVLEAVLARSGAIGYVDLLAALQSKAAFGAVKNRAGRFVTASVAAVEATAEGAADDLPADQHFTLTHLAGPDAYPICGCTFAVLFARQSGGRGQRLAEFLRWATTTGQQFANGLNYGRLPKALADKVAMRLAGLAKAP
jgi:phosphate ABC transporter phosphate-binding protein